MTPEQPRKVYAAHREHQRERILEAAERLFIHDGIDNVNLAEIARDARISRVTLYEYFPNKEEVAWAVFKKVSDELNQGFPSNDILKCSSGYEKIACVLEISAEGFEQHLDHLRFIAMFNFLYAREGSAERMRETIESSSPGRYDLFAPMIREGIADRSLRADLDPELTSAAIHNLLAGMTSRFALLGKTVEDEYGQPVKALYREIVRGFLLGLRRV